MPIVVDQKRLGGGSHSTMGTITDIYSVLRRLYSHIGKPYVGHSNVFSFNDPKGMCPNCNGLGRKMGVDLDLFLDKSKTLNEGAILFNEYAVDSWGWNILGQSKLFDMDKKLSKFSEKEMDLLLYSKPYKVKTKVGGKDFNLTCEGIISRFTAKYITRDVKTMSERTQKAVAPYITMAPCTVCKGARLSQEVLKCKIDGYNIAELASMEVGQLIGVIKTIKEPKAAPILKTLIQRLQYLVDIGLEYLTLNRETDTLSGGESQRVKIVKHLSSSLVDVMYVFDEPSVGLHPRDVHRLNELLQQLRDRGNTVLVVEHDPDVIKVADHIVDVGPHAGSQGGQVMYEGPFKNLLSADTLTGKYMKQSGFDQKRFPFPQRKTADQECKSQQPAERERGHPEGCTHGDHRCGGFGEELVNSSDLSTSTPGLHCDRPIRGGCFEPVQSRHLYRHHGRRAKGLRGREQGEPIPVQLQFGRRLRELPGTGRDLHGDPRDGRGQVAMRDLRGQTI